MSLEIMITVIIFLLILRCSKNIEGQFYDVMAGGSLQPCRIDPQTSLPDGNCKFFPDINQNTNSSLMFLPSLDSVSVEFACLYTFQTKG